MVNTHIFTDEAALDKVLAGARKLYEAVSVTMGPRGRNVIIKKAGGRAFMTHDGVTVARSVRLNDPAEEVAAELMKEAASKLDATTGDGTTTVTVLAYTMLSEAAKLVKAGMNPMVVKLQLESLEDLIVNAIKDKSVPVKGVEDLQAVATIAAGDRSVGGKVGALIFAAGEGTPVVLDFSNTADTTTELITGVRIESGPASPYLMDDAGLRAEIRKPLIVVVDAKLRDKEDVLPILKVIAGQPEDERDFLLVAREVAGDALQLLVVNKLKGFCNLNVVKVPASIGAPTEYLADIATSVGATMMSRNTGTAIKDAHVNYFGRAAGVIVTMTETVITGGAAVIDDLDRRINSLKSTIETSSKKEVRDFAEQRLKFLDQKVVSIAVGGQSDAEAQEAHYRYEDAVGACQAALRHGTVPGGGTLLYSIGSSLDHNGEEAMARTLQAPLQHVLDNAGIDHEEFGVNFNALNGFDVLHPKDGIVDLRKRGIIDPTESEIEAVKTAISIAGLLLTSGAMIVDEEVKSAIFEQ